MKIVLDTKKTLEQNAAMYFERAKKSKKKIEGARKAIGIAQTKLDAMQEEKEQRAAREQERRAEQQAGVARLHVRKQEWYEKLRWSISSDNILLVGGRDATTNEIVVKKHALKGDVVLHTDMAGAPFIVIKANNAPVPATTIEEAATLCACYCRAWKMGMASIEVFYVQPEQLSKEANSGEFLPKGAFMVRGSVKYMQPILELAIGVMSDGRIIVGHDRAVLAHARDHLAFKVLPGNEKSSDVAKRLAGLLKTDIDSIVAVLPAGGVKLGRQLDARTHVYSQKHAFLQKINSSQKSDDEAQNLK